MKKSASGTISGFVDSRNCLPLAAFLLHCIIFNDVSGVMNLVCLNQPMHCQPYPGTVATSPGLLAPRWLCSTWELGFSPTSPTHRGVTTCLDRHSFDIYIYIYHLRGWLFGVLFYFDILGVKGGLLIGSIGLEQGPL